MKLGVQNMIWKMNQNLFPFQNTSQYHIYFCKLSTAMQTMQYIVLHTIWPEVLTTFFVLGLLAIVYIFYICINSYKIPLVINNIFGDCQLLLHKITSKHCNWSCQSPLLCNGKYNFKGGFPEPDTQLKRLTCLKNKTWWRPPLERSPPDETHDSSSFTKCSINAASVLIKTTSLYNDWFVCGL